MKKITMVVCLLLGTGIIKAQNVVQAEYFIDADSGVGNNRLVTLTDPRPDGTYSFNVDLTGLSIGYHKLYVRTRDSAGKYSITVRRNIEVRSPNAIKKITGGEYFFDTDPGFAAANAIAVLAQDSLLLQDFAAVTGNLTVGFHKLYVRLRDNDGNWSITARRTVEIIKRGLYVIAGAEYFFNTDPGAGNASPVIFAAPAADGGFTFKVPLDRVVTGTHTLYIRARDSINNSWSITQWQKDSIITSTGLDSLWSHPATWSNNKVPDSNTTVLLHHKVYVDTTAAVCRSLAPYRNNAACIIWPNMKLLVTGKKEE